MNLEYVHFIKSVRMPTHQTELGALSVWRDSERDPQHPENDVPSWIITLTDRVVRISIAKHRQDRLGGNAEKALVCCVPIENIAWYREAETQPAPIRKTKSADIMGSGP